MNIYVGNLPYTISEEELAEVFSAYGEVKSASIIIDKIKNVSRGFGFVEMVSDADGQKAIDGLNDKEVQGRQLKVNEARPQERSFDKRPPRSFDNRGGGDRGGRGFDRGGSRGGGDNRGGGRDFRR
ncbi:RNA-binding protein [bacterium]|nr:RNA-binding protein [bacterium]